MDRAAAYYDELAARIAALPVIERAAATNHLPLSGYNWMTTSAWTIALIARQGGIYAALSLGVGLPMAVAAMRSIRGLLFGVQPGDLLTIAALGTIVVFATVGATIVPARHTMQLNPSQALRSGR